MIDYTFRSKILNSPIYDIYKKYESACYKRILYFYERHLCPSTPFDDISFRADIDIGEFYMKNFPLEWKECSRIYNADRARISRLRKFIDSLLSSDCLFLTLTFTDSFLSSTSSKTRRTYVSRFLRSLKCRGVANIDFGKKNGREHYHAVVQCSHVDFSSWPYGSINFKRILFQDKSSLKIAKYVAKLSNHAVKKTTKRTSLIYLRPSNI